MFSANAFQSLPSSHILDQLTQSDEDCIQTEDLIPGDASWNIGPYHPALSTPNLLSPDFSLAGPLSLEPAIAHVGTSGSDNFTFSPSITIRPEPSEFGLSNMDQDKGLSQEHGAQGPTATAISLQTDSLKCGSKTSSPQAKMRSASRKPKTFRGRPRLPANIRQARDLHNNVEKQYRTRLKVRFERLLSVLQASMLKNETKSDDGLMKDDYCFSRGEVLDAAVQRILTLEEENRMLATSMEMLSHKLMMN